MTVPQADYRLGERPLHEYLREHARRQPDKAAYHWYGNAITYAALDRMSDALAAKLAGLGVAKGDRVALFLNNCPQYIVAHFAIRPSGRRWFARVSASSASMFASFASAARPSLRRSVRVRPGLTAFTRTPFGP